RWDDFGYKTTYQATYHSATDSEVFLGVVKVMQKGQEKSATPTKLPRGSMKLDESYCSIGQALSYYENILELLPQDDAHAYLRRMQDLAANPDRITDFSQEDCYRTSLMRENGAQRALEDGTDLIIGKILATELRFSFRTSTGGEQFESTFIFGDSTDIPSRINAVIGYNGAGKTRLLANLAHVAWGDEHHRRNSLSHGELRPRNLAFGRVVAVSYSAFDMFDTPTSDAAKRAYVYCGLRDLNVPSQHKLKGQNVIADEIEAAVTRLKSSSRWQMLRRALEPLLREPSFRLSAGEMNFQDEPDTWRPGFDSLSTGHKISLNIVVQLVTQLENRSLVLLDEPETHLHPPLLAALMTGIAVALEETNSFAVVATHSPVVLQEIAKRHVQVIRRSGTATIIEIPPMETFGESIGVLTRTVFNLDNADSDHEGTLAALAKTHGTERINEVFPEGLSSQALGILLQNEID
ncbi:AAA family ATPase, partial [Janibacter sp. RAF20_2_2]